MRAAGLAPTSPPLWMVGFRDVASEWQIRSCDRAHAVLARHQPSVQLCFPLLPMVLEVNPNSHKPLQDPSLPPWFQLRPLSLLLRSLRTPPLASVSPKGNSFHPQGPHTFCSLFLEGASPDVAWFLPIVTSQLGPQRDCPKHPL